MKYYKILSIFCTLILSALLMFGCGENTSSSQSGASSQGNSSVSSVQSGSSSKNKSSSEYPRILTRKHSQAINQTVQTGSLRVKKTEVRRLSVNQTVI